MQPAWKKAPLPWVLDEAQSEVTIPATALDLRGLGAPDSWVQATASSTRQNFLLFKINDRFFTIFISISMIRLVPFETRKTQWHVALHQLVIGRTKLGDLSSLCTMSQGLATRLPVR